jgi:hypothetical protein
VQAVLGVGPISAVGCRMKGAFCDKLSACVQVQMRDMAGFVETRQQLLNLKPANKTNWISLAIAHHLSGNYSIAAQVC